MILLMNFAYNLNDNFEESGIAIKFSSDQNSSSTSYKVKTLLKNFTWLK